MDKSLFSAARRASGLTVDGAAQICGVSRPTYNAREKDPETFRLGELAILYENLDHTGRELLLRAVNSTFGQDCPGQDEPGQPEQPPQA